MSKTREVVMTIYKAYADRDLDAALSHCNDNMCFVWNAKEAMEPYCGECHGKAAFLNKLKMIDVDWEIVKYESVELICEGDSAAGRVQIEYQNKKTGNTIETEIGHFWQVEDNQAVKLIEFYDTVTMMASMN